MKKKRYLPFGYQMNEGNITQILFRAIRNGNLPEFLRIVESAALRIPFVQSL